jgi:YesN/AraC family two-component response regulator
MYRAIKEVDDDSKYKKSHLSEEKINEILKKLMEYIQSTKAYVNPKISLQSIAKDIDESTNHISQVINQKLEKNFYEFIYQFRIDRVKKMMNDPAYDDLSILEICYEVGFNSKSVFNIVFKEFEKMTPSQYRLKMKNK